jgi:signal transduction histidine kinase/CHASE3 domain sensor protein/FixJ family two-component response regulator
MTRYVVARANLAVFAVLIAILLLIGGMTWDSFSAARSARNWREHSYQVIGAIKDLGISVRDAETGQRGYLLTGRDDYLVPYRDALGQVTLLQGDLQRLTEDDPVQQGRLRGLAPVLQRKLEELAQTVQLRRTDGLEAALQIVRTDAGRTLTRQIEATLSDMSADESRILAGRLDAAERRGGRIRGLVLLGALCAMGGLLWAARMLNGAWRQAYEAEKAHGVLAQRLRTSLDSLSQGIAVFGPDRELMNWNQCFHVLMSLPVAMLRPGTTYAAFHDYLAKGGGALLEREDQIRHGAPVAGAPVVYEHVLKDGQQLEIRRTPMPDGGFVLTVTDMTRRAQAEAVLREVQKMQAIGQLTGGIAHDFNNLLTIILGNLDIAGDRPGDEQRQKIRRERAIWAAQRGATLTRQLLAFARKQPLAPAPIALAAVMPDFIPLLRRTLGEHIEVRYVETAGLWPAMADPAQLESALLNLALNARDAMPAGGRLTIELANKVLDTEYARQHAEVEPGDYTMLAVSDTGHGMAPDILARVFEPFFTTKPDGKGTGLGLAMVFGFVKQSAGHIKIYSEPGEGTTVRLYLPRAAAVPATGIQRCGKPIVLPRGSATILVVEDEAGVREIAVAILSELGYHVLEASDGEEGLRLFGAHAAEVDLLLTDVVLPGRLRGRDVAERITAMRPDVKILYMSGYTENAIVHNGRLDDGVQLISKPFQRAELAVKVAELLADGDRVQDDAAEDNVVAMQKRTGD